MKVSGMLVYGIPVKGWDGMFTTSDGKTVKQVCEENGLRATMYNSMDFPMWIVRAENHPQPIVEGSNHKKTRLHHTDLALPAFSVLDLQNVKDKLMKLGVAVDSKDSFAWHLVSEWDS